MKSEEVERAVELKNNLYILTKVLNQWEKLNIEKVADGAHFDLCYNSTCSNGLWANMELVPIPFLLQFRQIVVDYFKRKVAVAQMQLNAFPRELTADEWGAGCGILGDKCYEEYIHAWKNTEKSINATCDALKKTR